MKRKSLLKLMVALVLLPLSTRAQVHVEYSSQVQKNAHSGFKVIDYSDGKMFDKSNCEVKQFGHYKVYKEKRNRTPRKEAEDGVTLSFNVDFDHTLYDVSEITIFNETETYWIDPEEASWINPEYNEEEWYYYFPEGVSTKVAPGVYDIYIIFNHRPTNYYVIVEDVEVQEGTVVSLSPEMASNHISFKCLNPNGEQFRHGVGRWDENGDWVTTEPGNVEITDAETRILQKGGSQILKQLITFFGDTGEDEDPTFTNGTDFYVSDVSKYLFVQTFTHPSGYPFYDWYVNQFSIDDIHDICLQNDPSQYVLTEEKMDVTPDGKANNGFGTGIVRDTYLNGKLKGTYLMTWGNYADMKEGETLTNRVYTNLSSTNPKDNGLVTLLSSSIYDHVEPVVTPWGDVWDELVGLNSPLFRIDNGEKESVGIHIGPDSGLPVGPYDVFNVLPIHSSFTYKPAKIKGNLGGNTPINALVFKNALYPGSDVVSLNIGSYYVGRFGETRLGDGASTETNLKFNGKEVANPSEWSPTSNGVVDLTMKNTNILVDGLQGMNTTTIHFDMANQDNTPPTIQMLQFKDSEDYITDRFAEAKDGILEIAAADFNYFLNTETWESGFDYQPLNITAEYSPYSKEQWAKLEIEEVPELYNEMGWGYFFRASLKDVEGAGEKGWFDLRFSMSDEAGNTHVQTVSPAFRIDDLVDTGIENNNQYTITNNRCAEAVYDVMGRRMGNGQSNKGIRIVRKQNGDVRKVIVQ